MAPELDRKTEEPTSGKSFTAEASGWLERPAAFLGFLALASFAAGALAVLTQTRDDPRTTASGQMRAAAMSLWQTDFSGPGQPGAARAGGAAFTVGVASLAPGPGAGQAGGSLLVPLQMPAGHPPLALELRAGQPMRVIGMPSGHPGIGDGEARPGAESSPGDADGEAEDEELSEGGSCPYAGEAPGQGSQMPDDENHRGLRPGALPPGHPPIGPGAGLAPPLGSTGSRFDRPDWI